MKKISKQSISSENIFISDNNKEFPYAGLAKEEDEKYLYDKIKDLKVSDINIQKLNLKGEVFQASNKSEVQKIKNYCDIKGFNFEEGELPLIVIITDSLAISLVEINSSQIRP